jgi:hypothetical protein
MSAWQIHLEGKCGGGRPSGQALPHSELGANLLIPNGARRALHIRSGIVCASHAG